MTRIRKNKITAYDHDRIGAKLAEEFLSVFVKDANFKAKVVGLVRYHMHVFYIVKDLPFADVQGMKKSTDIKELAPLAYATGWAGQNRTRRRKKRTLSCF